MTVNDLILSEARVSLRLPVADGSELAMALREEAALLESLIGVLLRQRKGIAENDLTAVDETVHGSQRILLTLGEARKKRRRLLQILGGGDSDDGSGPEIGEWLGPAAGTAWSQLKEVAERLSTVLAVNQSVLQETIRFGEEYVRTAFGSRVPDGAGYTKDAERSAQGTGGVLINRKV